VTHRANPGLVSHFVKQALLDLSADPGLGPAVPIDPPTIEMPSGWRSSAPSPKPIANGTAPSIAAEVVVMIGRKRFRHGA
jgi:hypothetical protein